MAEQIKENWQRFCSLLTKIKGTGLTLDISRTSIDEKYISKKQKNLDEALEFIGQLEAGSIANPDENRQVGHYWLRDPELAPKATTTEAIKACINKVESFTKNIISEKKFTDALFIGIGGSALGPQLISDVFSTKDSLKLHFLDNTDPDGIESCLSKLSEKLQNTLVVVSSKSGSTIETKNGLIETKKRFQEHNIEFSKNAIAITCIGSSLWNLAKEENWLTSFPIWQWVGGRTSIFSAIGLLPLGLLAGDLNSFLEGAKITDQKTRNNNVKENPAALLSLLWLISTEENNKRNIAILPYKDKLILLSRYLQQLIMESLGKEVDFSGNVVNQGITVYGNKGSTDQHALVQQLREGPNDFIATFIQILNDGENVPTTEVAEGITTSDYLQGFFLGTREALTEKDRENITITLDELNEKSFASLLALFERAVGLYASMTGINAYNQPGVEAGKIVAKEIVILKKKIIEELKNCEDIHKGMSVIELSEKIEEDISFEYIYMILERLSFNEYSGIKKISGNDPNDVHYAFSKV